MLRNEAQEPELKSQEPKAKSRQPLLNPVLLLIKVVQPGLMIREVHYLPVNQLGHHMRLHAKWRAIENDQVGVFALLNAAQPAVHAEEARRVEGDRRECRLLRQAIGDGVFHLEWKITHLIIR